MGISFFDIHDIYCTACFYRWSGGVSGIAKLKMHFTTPKYGGLHQL